jgi:23S rRNA (guanosine2251-2'-O)-methyltransferase
VERLPIVRVANLTRALDRLREAGLWVVGLAADGDAVLWEVDLAGPTVLVAGAEGSGLGRLVREHCDFVVRVPMPGPTESLNVNVALSLALYESLRQRLAAR